MNELRRFNYFIISLLILSTTMFIYTFVNFALSSHSYEAIKAPSIEYRA